MRRRWCRTTIRLLVRLANLAEVHRFVLVGDKRQLSAVNAGKPFDLVQQAGIERANMDVNSAAAIPSCGEPIPPRRTDASTMRSGLLLLQPSRHAATVRLLLPKSGFRSAGGSGSDVDLRVESSLTVCGQRGCPAWTQGQWRARPTIGPPDRSFAS